MQLYSMYTDDELVTLLKSNEQLAFAELYDRYHQRIYGYFFNLIKLPDLTEDLVHEVFLKLWDVRERLNLRGAFSAYLFRMCHNLAVDTTKKLISDRKMVSELKDQYALLHTTKEWPKEDLRRLDNLVEEALSTLTPQRKTVYQMCRQEGKSYQQVGVELGITPNTVKEHMAKALAGLRQFLAEKGGLALIFMLL